MREINLKAKKRDLEKSRKQELREESRIPAVLYGPGVKNQPLALDSREFGEVYRQAGTSSLVNLKVGEKRSVKVIIHEIQFNPVTDQVIHVDLYQIKIDQELKTEIPLKFINQAPAVEEEAGNLIVDKEEIEVECLPKDLVDEIEVDISALKTFNDVIRIKDLKIPKNIKVLEKKDEVVVTTTAPRTKEELEALEEAPTESDVEEIEVEKEKEEEEETEKEEGEAEEGEEAPEGEEKTERKGDKKAQ